MSPEKRLLGNVDNCWTLIWTLLFISEFTKPFKLEVIILIYPQGKVGDDYSITIEGGVSYFLLIYMAFEGINFT